MRAGAIGERREGCGGAEASETLIKTPGGGDTGTVRRDYLLFFLFLLLAPLRPPFFLRPGAPESVLEFASLLIFLLLLPMRWSQLGVETVSCETPCMGSSLSGDPVAVFGVGVVAGVAGEGVGEPPGVGVSEV